MDPKSSILIIDDDPDTLTLLTDLFLNEGFERTMGAVTGKEIKSIIKDKSPAIILLDVNIVGEDSLRILEEIKLADPLIPVIMAAEQEETELAKRAVEFGACSYLIKSSPISEVVKGVKKELNKSLVLELKKKRGILIIDDDDLVADMTREFLEKEGYSCSVAADGRKALGIIKSQMPDLIFLDIVMPTIDGIELLGQIKQINKEIKVVMMSGITDKEVCTEAIAKGACGYITKPFSLQQLRVTVLTTLLENNSP